jgi:hypothetical protein
MKINNRRGRKMSNEQKLIEQNQTVLETQEDPRVGSLKREKDWFIAVEGVNETKSYYDKKEIKTTLRNAILEGRHRQASAVAIYVKTKDGKWNLVNKTLRDFAKDYFQLRILYQPVWGHAMAGMKWGILVGIGLKLLDTLILLGSINPQLAFFFLIAIVACCIPRIGVVGMIMVSYLMIKFSKVNFFFIGIAAALTGAILGCLPGMAIGGAIGMYRRSNLPLAQDVMAETGNLMVTTLILPLFGGTALLLFYFYVFNPWLIKVWQ